MRQTSVQDMPSSCPQSPTDARLVQEFSQGHIIFESQGVWSVQESVHVIGSGLLGALGMVFRASRDKHPREDVWARAYRGYRNGKQKKQDKRREKFIFHPFLR